MADEDLKASLDLDTSLWKANLKDAGTDAVEFAGVVESLGGGLAASFGSVVDATTSAISAMSAAAEAAIASDVAAAQRAASTKIDIFQSVFDAQTSAEESFAANRINSMGRLHADEQAAIDSAMVRETSLWDLRARLTERETLAEAAAAATRLGLLQSVADAQTTSIGRVFADQQAAIDATISAEAAAAATRLGLLQSVADANQHVFRASNQYAGETSSQYIQETSLVTALGEAIGLLAGPLAVVVAGVEAIGFAVATVAPMVISAVSSVASGISSVLSTTLGAVTSVVSTIGSGIVSAFSTAFSAVQSVVSTAVGAVTSVIGGIAGAAGRVAGDVVSFFASAFAKLAPIGAGALAYFMAGVGDDLERLHIKFNVAFKDMAGQAESSFMRIGQAMGMSQREMLTVGSSVQMMMTSFGLSNQAAAQMSEGVTKLAIDLATLNDVSVEQATKAISGGLMGNLGTLGGGLRGLGVALDAVQVKEGLFNDGLSTKKEKTDQAAVALERYNDEMFRSSGALTQNTTRVTEYVRQQKAAYEMADLQIKAEERRLQTADKRDIGAQRAIKNLQDEKFWLDENKHSFDIYAQGLEAQARADDNATKAKYEARKIQDQYNKSIKDEGTVASETMKVQERWNLIQGHSNQLTGIAGRLTDTFAGTMRVLKSTVADVAGEVGGHLTEAFKSVFKEMGGTLDLKFKEDIRLIFGLVGMGTQALIKLGAVAIRAMGDWIEGMGGVQAILTIVKDTVGVVTDFVVGLWDTVSSTFMYWVDQAGGTDAIMNTVKGTVKSVWEWVKTLGKDVYKYLKDWVDQAGGVDAIMNTVRDTVKDAWEWVSKLGNDTYDYFANWVKEAGGVEGIMKKVKLSLLDVKYAVKDAWQTTKEWFGGIEAVTSMFVRDMGIVASTTWDVVSAISRVFFQSVWDSPLMLGIRGLVSLLIQVGSLITGINSESFQTIADSYRSAWSEGAQNQRTQPPPDAGGPQYGTQNSAGMSGVPSGLATDFGGGAPDASYIGGMEGVPSELSADFGGGMASGGWVTGPSGHDNVPARLTAGEFVVPRTVARSNVGFFNDLQAGRRPTSSFSASSQISSTIHMPVTIYTTGKVDIEGDVIPQLERVKRRLARRTS